MKSSEAKSENSSIITENGFRILFGTSASTFAETDFKSWRINLPMDFAVSRIFENLKINDF